MLTSRTKCFAAAATLLAFATAGTAPVNARMATHHSRHHAQAFTGKGLYNYAGSNASMRGQKPADSPAATGGGNVDFNNKTHTNKY